MSRRKMDGELFDARKVQEYEEAMARKRLEQAAGAPASAEGRGVLPFVVKGEPDEDQITGRAGLTLTVEALRAYRADELIRRHLKVKKRQRGYDEVAMVEAFVVLLASGGEHLEDFGVLREDGGLCRLLDRALPSPDVARRFLLHFHDDDLIEAARKAAEAAGEKSFVPEEKPTLQALGRIQAELTRRMADREISTCATLDHDATVIDSHKQTATWHYKGGDGLPAGGGLPGGAGSDPGR